MPIADMIFNKFYYEDMKIISTQMCVDTLNGPRILTTMQYIWRHFIAAAGKLGEAEKSLFFTEMETYAF